MDTTAGLGHNQPPEPTLATTLSAEFEDDMKAAQECLDSAARAPSRIEDGDDETLNKCAELVKKMRAIELKFENAEKAKRQPVKAVLDAIGGFFKSQYEPLAKKREVIKKATDDYLARKKALEEKRLREEEERRREEQRIALARAKDAEDTKNEAAARLAEAERIKQEAADARSAAITDMDNAVADVAEAKAKLAKVRSDAAQVAADIAKATLDGFQMADDVKAAKRKECQDAAAAARADLETAEATLKAARDAARKAKEEQAAREAEQAAAARKVREAEREVKSNLAEAVRHEVAADKIEAKIDGPGADLARTRSLHGAVTTLQRRWKCEMISREDITEADILKLFPFINGDAVAKAGWVYMMAQTPENRTLSGFRMFEDEESMVR